MSVNDEIGRMLSEEIENHFEALGQLDILNEERSKVINEMVKLYNLRLEGVKLELEEIKLEDEAAEKVAKRHDEDEYRAKQLAEQVKDRYFSLGIDVATLVLSM